MSSVRGHDNPDTYPLFLVFRYGNTEHTVAAGDLVWIQKSQVYAWLGFIKGCF